MRVSYIKHFIDCENYEDLEKHKQMLEHGVIYHAKFSKPFGTDGGSACDCVYNADLDILTYLRNPVCGIPDWYMYLPHKDEEPDDIIFKYGWLDDSEYNQFMYDVKYNIKDLIKKNFKNEI